MATPIAEIDGLLSTEQAAQFISMSPRYLVERRLRGGGPPYIRISHRCVRYSPQGLRQWLQSRTYTATCQETRTAEDEAA